MVKYRFSVAIFHSRSLSLRSVSFPSSTWQNVEKPRSAVATTGLPSPGCLRMILTTHWCQEWDGFLWFIKILASTHLKLSWHLVISYTLMHRIGIYWNSVTGKVAMLTNYGVETIHLNIMQSLGYMICVDMCVPAENSTHMGIWAHKHAKQA